VSTQTGIQWTDHTLNPWWGCTKVHAGCTHCYAEAWDKRTGGAHWGNGPRRMILGEWGKPALWNAAAKAAGRRARVFCASMCDLFEDYGGPVVDQQGHAVEMKHHPGRYWTVPLLRHRVFQIVEETPWLDWQLLTKRPENIAGMVPVGWMAPGAWPTNVWTGTSPCNQETADACIPALLKVPGPHFLSCEPLIGAVSLKRYLAAALYRLLQEVHPCDESRVPAHLRYNGPPSPGWVIVGGESGKGARPCDAAWIRSIVEECRAARVPVFVKQLGDLVLDYGAMTWPGGVVPGGGHPRLRKAKGDDPSEWPEDLRVQEEMPRRPEG
jgi:protein gp37